MLREVLRREISPTGDSLVDSYPVSFDLRWAAWGASVETLQIDLVAGGWMSLFAALLEPVPQTELRWLADGPGANAEVKRAYSALFGRFFGRGALRRDHSCRWLRQVKNNLELAPGVYLRRKPGYEGDLPDWVGWDDRNRCFVVAEAKGSHDQGNWGSGTPPPLKTALTQLERVNIVDSSGPIQFKTWAVACRWGTTTNNKVPTIITCDPQSDGRKLSERESASMREAMRRQWTADLLDGLGRTDIAEIARHPGVSASASDIERDPIVIGDRIGYAALAIEGAGVIPLTGAARPRRAQAIIETARGLKREVALILFDLMATERAISGGDIPKQATDHHEAITGEFNEITVDGVTFRTIGDDIPVIDDAH